MTQDIFHIVGTTLGGTYEVERAVAEGGFGVLYRAYHGAFRAPVALKCLKVPASVTEADHADLLEKFRKEAEVMFRLSAAIPTVVRPLHVDAITTDEGVFVPYMVLEWLEGETLDALVIRRAQEGKPALGLKTIAQLLTPIARALERAHKFPSEEGFVSISHCDLKPENVFLSDFHGETVAKILDFGIAKVRQATQQIIGRQSQTGELSAFSPCYAAPEQWLPKRFGAAGPWTDIWGLALTMVEAAAGRQIMSNDFQAAIGTAIDEKRRPTPRNEGVTVSDAVEAIFERALAVDPKNRQPNMAAFWNEIEDALGLERSRSAGQTVQPRSEVPPALARPGIGELDSPVPHTQTPGARGGRAGQVAAALQLKPDPSLEPVTGKDPASGPHPRVTPRPGTFPADLMIPRRAEPTPSDIPPALAGDSPRASDPPRLRESGPKKKSELFDPPPEAAPLSLELEDFSPPSRKGRPEPAPVATSRKAAEPQGVRSGPADTSPRRRPALSRSGAPAWHSLRIPIAMIVVGVAVSVVGGANQVGGIQVNLVAGGVAGVGILLGLWRLFGG
jgi:serine/threonine protein kinase